MPWYLVPAKANSPNEKRRYEHPEYDDSTIEALMKYFKFNAYSELCWFLGSVSRNKHVLPDIKKA